MMQAAGATPTPSALDRWASGLQRVQLRIAMVVLLAMMAETVLDVSLRYFFGRPLGGSYDFVQASLVVFVFFGISTAFLHRRNLVIDLIDSFVSRPVAVALQVVGGLAGLACLALIGAAMIPQARQTYEYGDHQLELGLPLWILWATALVGIAGAFVCALAGTFARTAPTRNDIRS